MIKFELEGEEIENVESWRVEGDWLILTFLDGSVQGYSEVVDFSVSPRKGF